MTVPLSEAYTLKPAKTGFGDKGTEVPTPPNLAFYQRPIFAWNETVIPMKVQGKTMRLDRDGDFASPDVWDQLFYRDPSAHGTKSKVET